MKKKYSILNWVLGNLLTLLGVAFSTKSNFGLSMIGASPYILHVYFHQFFSWFTQGTSEYIFEAILLLITCLVIKKFRWQFLLSFVEAVVAGLVLDFWFIVLGGNGPVEGMAMRIIYLLLGLVVGGLGIAFFFNTKMPLQVYDLAVVELVEKTGKSQKKVKQLYDLFMLVLSLALSFILTHRLTGMGIGTIVITLCNSSVIHFWSNIIQKVEK